MILVEGLFDLAALWQSGFRNTTCAIGTHLTPAQWAQLCDQPGRCVYIAFDQDSNQAGQQCSRLLARRLESAGLKARIVALPPSHDPNSYFMAGATAADFLAATSTTHETACGPSACCPRQCFSLSPGRRAGREITWASGFLDAQRIR